jgi:hypothetical protein
VDRGAVSRHLVHRDLNACTRLTTTALNPRGEEIDGDMRRVTVPALDGSRLAIGSPMVLAARMDMLTSIVSPTRDGPNRRACRYNAATR